MPIITSADGQVINWSGNAEGPRQPNGNVVARHEYTVQLGTKEVVVSVSDLAKLENGLGPDIPKTEEIVKRCIVRFIENHYSRVAFTDARDEHQVDGYKMRQLLEQMLQHSGIA